MRPAPLRSVPVRGAVLAALTRRAACRLPPAEDCSAVATLRALGAVLVGKTGLPELAMSGVGVNGASGAPRNPWHLSRLCGGSSSGARFARLVATFRGARGAL